ncbi:M23 family metallopeptidase [Streptomyces sp. NPDC060031]|uniref:M23 family metallopeptidase n=1 Tax=Streptomyces sp. NPDC060031 TaxID=3347043 RepID=UPI00367CCC73
MNDRPSSGQYPDYGYDGLSTTTFAGDSPQVSYETQGQGYNYAAYGSYDTGAYDTTAWTTQENYAHPSQDGYLSTIPAQGVPEDATGQWDASAWNTPSTDYQATDFGYDTTSVDQTATGNWSMPGYSTMTGTGPGTETGATAWNTVPQEQPQQEHQAYEYTYDYAYQPEQQPEQQPAYDYTAEAYSQTAVFEVIEDGTEDGGDGAPDVDPVHDLPTQAMPVTSAAAPLEPRPSRRAGAKGSAKSSAKSSAKPAAAKSSSGGNSRRRTPAKRSALLTVAVPSACVMGVAGVAAASVGGLTGADMPADDSTTTMAAPDPASVVPVAANSKLDTQLAALSADAGDFADRASRTQERIDLHQRQEDEKKRKAEEAAAKEAARPKFAIPVEQHGLSATFGQAGGMWMSVHTGIDFPVSYGTPVMAATDGTVRTQFNSAYGNMAIVTAADGTETWYCHLSSTKIRSGKVKAGDVIAYSGNSGNSTGPHLHFEVRPGGGAAIDPLPWLRSHDLDPN